MHIYRFHSLCALLAAALSASLLVGGCSTTSTSSSSAAPAITQANACGADEYGCPADEDAKKAAKREAYAKDVEGYTPITFDDAIELCENGGEGLIYFGFPDCPWCDEVVPLLTKSTANEGVEVLYVRTRDDDHERLYTDEQRDQIEPYLSDYIRNSMLGEPTLYVPLVVYVNDGKVVAGHQGTVDDHDAKEREMTDEEREALEQELNRIAKLAAEHAKEAPAPSSEASSDK